MILAVNAIAHSTSSFGLGVHYCPIVFSLVGVSSLSLGFKSLLTISGMKVHPGLHTFQRLRQKPGNFRGLGRCVHSFVDLRLRLRRRHTSCRWIIRKHRSSRIRYPKINEAVDPRERSQLLGQFSGMSLSTVNFLRESICFAQMTREMPMTFSRCSPTRNVFWRIFYDYFSYFVSTYG